MTYRAFSNHFIKRKKLQMGRRFEREHLQGLFLKNKACIKNKIPAYKDIREFDFLSTSRRYSEKRLQMGRSMVEMLAVLAIIGVLSIAGLAAYRMAINSYKANEILNDVRLAAATVLHQENVTVESDNTINISEFKQTIPYDLNALYVDRAETFAIEVVDVEEGVCKSALNKVRDAYSIIIDEDKQYDGSDNSVCANDLNRMWFLFDDTGLCEPECPECCFGVCCEGDKVCHEESRQCVETCGEGKFWSDIANACCNNGSSECPNGCCDGQMGCCGGSCCPNELCAGGADNGVCCGKNEEGVQLVSDGSKCICPDTTPTGADEETCLCPEGKHEDNGICCPFAQYNKDGVCTCETGRTACGDECCVAGESCQEGNVCCAAPLCDGVCCATGMLCQEFEGKNTCVCENGNPLNSAGECCPEGEKMVDYFTLKGERKQTCCEKSLDGADVNGICCPKGLVGSYGYNHGAVWFSTCCPKEGQGDKGMAGRIGVSETWACAPENTTMDATGYRGASHSWYAPTGSKNVNTNGLACGPEQTISGRLHSTCGNAGFYCTHGQTGGTTSIDDNPYTCYCSGRIVDGKCILPDCANGRQHTAFCYCNPENGSIMEYNYFGGTWGSSYVHDVCVTPIGSQNCTKNYTFKYSYQGIYYCFDCKTYAGSYSSTVSLSKVTVKDDCLNCPQTVWNGKCIVCPTGQEPNKDRTACETPHAE